MPAVPAKISVVTLSLNQADFLEQAIQSVLSQDHASIEYIVVDAGSTDGSRAIIERYRGKFAHCIFEPDQGPADGLNKGFARATGEIFCYLNADDVFLPGALRCAARELEARPEVDVVLGDGELWDAGGAVLRRIFSRQYKMSAACYGAVSYVQQASFMRAAAFRRTAGFNVRNRICWDAELFADLALAGARFHYLPVLLGAQRAHGKALSATDGFAQRRLAEKSRIAQHVLGRQPSQLEMSVMREFHRFARFVDNPAELREAIRWRARLARPR
jgi:glycosyltransferase involved in cell wall biosynthesis